MRPFHPVDHGNVLESVAVDVDGNGLDRIELGFHVDDWRKRKVTIARQDVQGMGLLAGVGPGDVPPAIVVQIGDDDESRGGRRERANGGAESAVAVAGENRQCTAGRRPGDDVGAAVAVEVANGDRLATARVYRRTERAVAVSQEHADAAAAAANEVGDAVAVEVSGPIAVAEPDRLQASSRDEWLRGAG